METPAIRIRGLIKRYGALNAVDGVDLDVARGEIFALLGPNGAGKTTTVEICEGYRRRDGGQVSVLGIDPGNPTLDWRARIGIVLQSVHDLEEITVTEAVQHVASLYPSSRDIDEVIDAVGLTQKASSRAGKLSGGQRRRLDVALGIVGKPELLFLDEPTTGFDPEARRSFWGLIDSLRDGGTTILLTTHYLDEAEALADRVAVIAAGKILELGTPETLGGRATSLAVVSWLENDEPHVEHTATPTAFVTSLANRLGDEINGLQVTRASLEDIYLTMIAAQSATDSTLRDPGLHATTGNLTATPTVSSTTVSGSNR